MLRQSPRSRTSSQQLLSPPARLSGRLNVFHSCLCTSPRLQARVLPAVARRGIQSETFKAARILYVSSWGPLRGLHLGKNPTRNNARETHQRATVQGYPTPPDSKVGSRGE